MQGADMRGLIHWCYTEFRIPASMVTNWVVFAGIGPSLSLSTVVMLFELAGI